MSTPSDITGEELRDEGMALSAEAEDRNNPGWDERALDAIRFVAEDNEYFTSDDVREHFSEEPHHPNAWGAVWKKAVRLRWIEEATDKPRVKSRRPLAHASKIPVYKSHLWI